MRRDKKPQAKKLPRIDPESIRNIKISEPVPSEPLPGLYLDSGGHWKRIADIDKDVDMTRLKITKFMTLESAIALAADAHRGQVDLGGQPYILHPLRVMSKFSTYEGRMAAVLHDVVEDTKWTLAELERASIPMSIVRAIDRLTRRKDKGETYLDYIDRVCRDRLARHVKIEDLKDNLDFSRLNLEDIPKYISLIKREKKALSFCLSAEKDNYA